MRWTIGWCVLGLLLALSACTAQEEPQQDTVLADTVGNERPVAVMTDGRTVKQRLADATIATEVQQALLDTMDLRRFDFEVASVRGRVALRGSVYTPEQQTLAATIARKVDGVEELANEIALFPPDSVKASADSTRKPPL